VRSLELKVFLFCTLLLLGYNFISMDSVQKKRMVENWGVAKRCWRLIAAS
jgi:hypothetical protein